MSKKTTIHVGDLVRFQYGKNKVTGTVKEDRGPIGIKGRRLYLISSSPEPEFSFQIELPPDDIEGTGFPGQKFLIGPSPSIDAWLPPQGSNGPNESVPLRNGDISPQAEHHQVVA